MSADIAVVGLGTMGANLAINIDSRGYTVALHNRTKSKMTDTMLRSSSGRMVPCDTLSDCVQALKKPRKIILMVTDTVVELFVESFKGILEAGDILIDGGNSYWRETERRQIEFEKMGVHFIGMGISGGEEGALYGPSMMFGGAREAWDHCREILEAISAKAADGSPCVDWIGLKGSGHFVKMVHNAIEYADLQIIAETYNILKSQLKCTNEEIADAFKLWDQYENHSFLIETAEKVVRRREGDRYLIDFIKDSAAQKGTGKWTAQDSFDIGYPTPVFTEAVEARLISSLFNERQNISIKKQSTDCPISISQEMLGDALYASKIIAYSQGFALINEANEHFGYCINLTACARVWRNGCIIRARILDSIVHEFGTEYRNLITIPVFTDKLLSKLDSWRKVVAVSTLTGIPTPVISSSLNFFEGYTSRRLPANLIQGIRDYFGAHTYERLDKDGFFHTDWSKE